MMKFRNAKVNILNEARPLTITSEGIRILRRGQELFIKADSIISALGMYENQDLIKELAGKGIAIYGLGDCVDPRKIAEANKAGYRTGLQV